MFAPHRFEQLPAELGQPAWRARAAAVARPAPGGADDPHSTVRPRTQLGRGLDGVRALHEEDGGDPALLPAFGVRAQCGAIADEVQAAGAVVVDLRGG